MALVVKKRIGSNFKHEFALNEGFLNTNVRMWGTVRHPTKVPHNNVFSFSGGGSNEAFMKCQSEKSITR
jgi:hypothetical protein